MTNKVKKWHAGATKRRSKYKNRTAGKRAGAKRGTKHKYTKRGGVPKWMKKCWPWCNRQQSSPEEQHQQSPKVIFPQDIVSPSLVSPVVVSPPAKGMHSPHTSSRRVRRVSAQQLSPSQYTPVIIESLKRNWNFLKHRIMHNIKMHKINSEIPILIGRDEFHNLTQQYTHVIDAYETHATRNRSIEAANELNALIKQKIKILASSTPISSFSPGTSL